MYMHRLAMGRGVFGNVFASVNPVASSKTLIQVSNDGTGDRTHAMIYTSGQFQTIASGTIVVYRNNHFQYNCMDYKNKKFLNRHQQ